MLIDTKNGMTKSHAVFYALYLEEGKGREYIPLEILPSVFVGCVVIGTQLPGDVIMPDHIVGIQIISLGEIAHQLHQRLISLIGKLSGLVWVAALNRDGVVVPGIRAVGDLIEWDALDYGAVNADDKMTAGIGFAALRQTGEIAAVGFRRCVGVAGIVNDYPVDMLQWDLGTGIRVFRKQIHCHPAFLQNRLDMRGKQLRTQN